MKEGLLLMGLGIGCAFGYVFEVGTIYAIAFGVNTCYRNIKEAVRLKKKISEL